MKIFTLKKNKDGDTEFRLSKEVIVLLSVFFGVMVTLIVAMVIGSWIFYSGEKTKIEKTSKKLEELYGDKARKW